MEFAKKFMTEKAEKFNGKAAMLGMFALVGAYYFTGQIVSDQQYLNQLLPLGLLFQVVCNLNDRKILYLLYSSFS